MYMWVHVPEIVDETKIDVVCRLQSSTHHARTRTVIMCEKARNAGASLKWVAKSFGGGEKRSVILFARLGRLEPKKSKTKENLLQRTPSGRDKKRPGTTDHQSTEYMLKQTVKVRYPSGSRCGGACAAFARRVRVACGVWRVHEQARAVTRTHASPTRTCRWGHELSR